MPNPQRFVKAIFVAIICCFAVVYIYKQVLGASHTDVESEFALAVSLEKTLSSTGYIIRSETVLKNDSGGVVISVVDDGEKVSSGMEIANIYTDGKSTDAKARLDEIDSRLVILKSSIVDQEYFSADVAKLEKDKNEITDTVMRGKAKGKLSDCVAKKDELLIGLNKLYTVKYGTSYDDKINELENERMRLASNTGAAYSRLYAPIAGYYDGVVDGSEGILSPDDIDELSYDGFVNVMNRKVEAPNSAQTAGKIITDSRWYVALALPKSDTASFVSGKSYSVVFPYSSGIKVDMELYRVISETDKVEDVLVFTSNEMPTGFSYTRIQKVEVVAEHYEGLKVPKTALRMLDDGTKGVYVLTGEAVSFKRAEEIYAFDDSYIIRYETEEEKAAYALQSSGKSEIEDNGQSNEIVTSDSCENSDNDNAVRVYPYLALYDNVIVGGKELYDGKRLG